MNLGPTVNLEAKNHLARLLATEDIYVRHRKVKTASFDTKNRVLTFPIWKTMSDALYTMLAGHEVGHALYTPPEWAIAAEQIDKKRKAIAATYLNIIEDVRIERLIKSIYPGIRPIFAEAYADLFEQNMFKTRKQDLNRRCFIDRINLHYKVGAHITVPFTAAEQALMVRADQTQTWDDVVALSTEIYQWSQQNESQPEPQELVELDPDDLPDPDPEDESSDDEYPDETDGPEVTVKVKSETGESEGSEESDDEPGDGSDDAPGDAGESDDTQPSAEHDHSPTGDSDAELPASEGQTLPSICDGKDEKEGDDRKPKKPIPGPPPEPVTQKAFDDNIVNLNDTHAREIVYLTIPEPNLDNILVDHTVVHYGINAHFVNRKGRDGTDRFIIAEARYKTFRADNEKKVNYIFQQFERKKQADRYKRTKTHKTGEIDPLRLATYRWADDIFKTVASVADGKNHALVIVIDWSGSMRKNIVPSLHQAMVITNFCRKANIPFEVYSLTNGGSDAFDIKPGDLVFADDFRMRNYLSSRMTAKQYHDACVNLFALMPEDDFDTDGVPDENLIGCTPLNEAIVTTIRLAKLITKRTKAQITNTIFLTDGDANTVNHYMTEAGKKSHIHTNADYIIEDPLTHRQYEFRSRRMTPTMYQILKDRGDVNVVGFYMDGTLSEFFTFENEAEAAMVAKKFEDDGYVVATGWGYDELYIVRDSKLFEIKKQSLTPAKQPSKQNLTSTSYVDAVAEKFMSNAAALTKQRIMLDRFVKMIA